ncbi:MAG: hypothetical protein QNK05_17275 [Myxococcota bacterium]|nr:hypothetical protein [Myxococcota bacterium]
MSARWPTLLLALLLTGCITDGPAGPIPGGTFSGELETGPEPDWSFATDLDSVDIQIFSSRPRTVRTGIVVHEGVPYLPVTWSPLKRWQWVVREEPRILLRADGRLFERRAVPIDDEAERLELVAKGQAKYGFPFHARATGGITKYFRLDPPQGGDGPRP